MTATPDPDLILRVAAKGDGVTADGRHIAFSAPLDRLSDDGGLIRGPHHVEPPCQHFRTCGGCSLQHLDAESYSRFLTERVAYALEGQGLAAEILHPPQISRPPSRIRASSSSASAAPAATASSISSNARSWRRNCSLCSRPCDNFSKAPRAASMT